MEHCKVKMKLRKNQSLENLLVRCLSRYLTLEEVKSDITHVQNSLNNNFTGIHTFEYLFIVKFYEKQDEDEISRTILKI